MTHQHQHMNYATRRRIQEQEQEGATLIGRARGLQEAMTILRELKAAHDEAYRSGTSDPADRAYALAASVALAAALACIDDRWEQRRIEIDEVFKMRADLYALAARDVDWSEVADAPTVTLPALQA